MSRRVRSGRVAVLVHKSTKDVDAVDPPNLGQAGRCRLTLCGGHAQINAPMGAGSVVMLHIDGQHLLEVAPVPDQQLVQALGPQAERRVGTVRRECTDRILIAGQRHLATVLCEYTAHYNGHRPHRSLAQRSPEPRSGDNDLAADKVRRRPILGGLINEYSQAA
jgi:hypothetical protein